MIGQSLPNRKDGSLVQRILTGYAADSVSSKEFSHPSTLGSVLPQRTSADLKLPKWGNRVIEDLRNDSLSIPAIPAIMAIFGN
jgi:hypothetical protein